MIFIFYLFIFLFGVIIGSFLNVVVLRLHTRKISRGRSRCGKCGHELGSKDLVPVLSFLFLRGRCRYCKLRMSRQYITVELITGFVFLLVAHKLFSNIDLVSLPNMALLLVPFLKFILYSIAFSLLIVLSVYDVKHYILPWRIMRFFLLISLCVFLCSILFSAVDFSWLYLGIKLLGAVLVPLPFYILWLLSKGRLIGFGDIELMAGFGLLLGLLGGYLAVIFGFWLGALFVVCKLCITMKPLNPKSMIPFGPFLSFGALIALLYGQYFIDFVFSMV
jgi:leader peptidase (prepilin peptidase)/N-methyltransferase